MKTMKTSGNLFSNLTDLQLEITEAQLNYELYKRYNERTNTD